MLTLKNKRAAIFTANLVHSGRAEDLQFGTNKLW